MGGSIVKEHLNPYQSVSELTPNTTVIKGRGAASNPVNRYAVRWVERELLAPVDAAGAEQPSPHLLDSREALDEALALEKAAALAKAAQRQIPAAATQHPASELAVENAVEATVSAENAKSIITRNRSPDVPFEHSINAYRGCEHGCIYCFARPYHAYVDLSPGLDFETKLYYKANADTLFEQELAKPGYSCSTIAMGTATDPYQPIEKQYAITRKLLLLCCRYQHPVTIVTKSKLILRDLDVLQELARKQLCSVMISVTTLDRELKRRLEPRTASPQMRLNTIEALATAGVPVGVLAAPVIPKLNDAELEKILAASAQAGAQRAAYILLRLPLEVHPLFVEWLGVHYPTKAEAVMSIIRQSRDGKANSAQFGQRMVGNGVFADLIRHRFHQACRRYGLEDDKQERATLRTDLFIKPQKASKPPSPQLPLW